jgi:pimeloyl-ACP methyl ester carboxylesterase
MYTPTILIDGTWGRRDEGQRWIHKGSSFVTQAQENGVQLIDLDDPFDWSTLVDGTPLDGDGHDIWESWGMALKWYITLKNRGRSVNLVAHSHGGQVAAYAIQFGAPVNTLVTVATPVRKDMLPVWNAGEVNTWFHIHTGYGDWWQIFGEFGDGHLKITREMPDPAINIDQKGEDHSSLLGTNLWFKQNWWDFIKD